ncbi:MAG: 4-alpha-glucanotransferase [Steroidobacteraceae bacterium]
MSAPMNAQLIEQLAQQRGIGSVFYDYRGDRHVISAATKAALLDAMGIPGDCTVAPEAGSQQLLAPVFVIHEKTPASVAIHLEGVPQDIRIDWQLTLEHGETRSGFIPAHTLQSAVGQLALPDALPLGYHELRVRAGQRESTARIVIAPQRCHAPDVLAHTRVWGIAVQLYTLRSPRNWGMGDFADLRELIDLAAPLGCAIVGVNPLHALMPANPAHISPYSPSSREFLNVLYIAVPEVPEFERCKRARQRVAQREFEQELQVLRASPVVSYVRVAQLKLEVLRLLHAEFAALPAGDTRRRDFKEYLEVRGESLRLHALYDALDEHFRRQSPDYWGWPSWPDEYRDPLSPAVRKFAQAHAGEVEFHCYLQWLAEEQLAQAQKLARERGMALGLYGDVAVGVNSAGSETWANPTLYRQKAAIGAPPDPLALMGQDWGIPPQDPYELREQQFAPYAQMLRNNMRHIAALRLDHVMALFRLWWVPRGFASKDGAYVHYPLDALMSILALESERNRCLVIGEDLGTVPDEVRDAMHRFDVYHYRVLLFEKQKDGQFKPPMEYAPNSLATVTTHDLPTLKGWWESGDIELREALKLFPNERLRDETRAARTQDRAQLMRAMAREGLWHWQPHEPLPAYSPALARAIHAYLGLSRANVALIQLEDLIGMSDAVNVPGTSDEHANWQRKMTLDTKDIFARADVLDIVGAMKIARTGVNPNA